MATQTQEQFVSKNVKSRREFLKATVAAALATFFGPSTLIGQTATATTSPRTAVGNRSSGLHLAHRLNSG
jgi:anaerobic selenocysteine-containing dehydrogenase